MPCETFKKIDINVPKFAKQMQKLTSYIGIQPIFRLGSPKTLEISVKRSITSLNLNLFLRFFNGVKTWLDPASNLEQTSCKADR